MIDDQSATWRHIAKYVEGELAAIQKRLEVHRLDMAPTEFERGRAAALRALLSLTETRVPVQSSDPKY